MRELKKMLDYNWNHDPHGIPMVISDIKNTIDNKETEDKIAFENNIHKRLGDIDSDIKSIMYLSTNSTANEEDD
jgi:hypothetical protein